MSLSAVLRSPRSEVVIPLASAGGWEAVGRYARGVGGPILELWERGRYVNTAELSASLAGIGDAPGNIAHTLSMLSLEIDGGADDESIEVRE